MDHCAGSLEISTNEPVDSVHGWEPDWLVSYHDGWYDALQTNSGNAVIQRRFDVKIPPRPTLVYALLCSLQCLIS